MTKKLVSMLLVLMLLIGLVPTAALSASANTGEFDGEWVTLGSTNEASVTMGGETTEYETLQDAIKAVASSTDRSTTVKLLRDIAASRYVEADKGIFTLDLNGKVWTRNATAFYVYNTADIKIIDSSTEQSGKIFTTNDTSIVVYGDAKLEVAGGTIESTLGCAILLGLGINTAENAELTISGGQIKATSMALMISSKQVTLKGGTIEGEIEYYNGILNIETDYPDAELYFRCEDYSSESNRIILSEGYGFYYGGQLADTLVYGYDYTIGALPAVSNNEASVTMGGVTTEYETLQDAINAVASSTDRSTTVKLLRDIAASRYVAPFSGIFTLDLNGKSWTATNEILYVCGTADVKLIDSSVEQSGKIYNTSNRMIMIIMQDSAKLEIAGGTIEKNDSGVAVAVGVNAYYPVNVELTVSGGQIKAEGVVFFLSAKSVTLTGGTIEGKIEYYNGILNIETDYPDAELYFGCEDYSSESNRIILPEGYGFYCDGQLADTPVFGYEYTIGALPAVSNNEASVTMGGVTTEYENLQDAIYAVAYSTDRSTTVKLLRDIAASSYVAVTDGIFTLDLNGKSWTATSEIFYLCGTADVKLIDSSVEQSGKIYNTSNHSVMIIIQDSAKLEIAGGTIENKGLSMAVAVGVNANAPMNAELTVSGGQIKAEGIVIFLAAKSVTLTGGSFEGKIEYRAGKLNIEVDDTDFNLYFGAQDYPTESNQIILPEGYGFYSDGRLADTLVFGRNYTIGALSTTEPKITDIRFNADSPAYDQEKNLFTLDAEHPLVITVTGENLTKYLGLQVYLFSNQKKAYYVDMTIESDTTAVLTLSESALNHILEAFRASDYIARIIGFTVSDDPNYNFGDVSLFLETERFPDTRVETKEVDNGFVSASPMDAQEGDTVTVTATPDAGCKVATLTVIDEKGNRIPLDENNSFVMPRGVVTVQATFMIDSTFHEKDGYKIIWSEKFDGESLPEDFTSIDADGDGYGWIGNSGALEQGLSGVANHDCDSGHSIASPSYIVVKALPLDSDNHLVFPAFELKKGNEYLLSFMIRCFYNMYPDTYSVAISLDGGNTFVKTFEKAVATESWKEVVIDLSEYAGNTVTVVVLHQAYDQYYLMLDCVHLYEKVTVIGDLYSELDVLENAVADLQTALSDAASVEALNGAIENLNKAIEDAKKAVLEADSAQKQELLSEISKAQNAAVEAAEKALDEARKELEAAIDKKADITALNDAIEALNDAIALAKTAAEEANSALRTELLSEIEKAQKAAVDASAKALEEAKKALQAAIDKKADITALDQAIEDLTDAIALAKTAAEEANSALRTELLSEIEKAQKAATDTAEKALEEARLALQDAIEKGDKANADALAEAVKNLNSAIELAKKTAADADAALKTDLEGQIGEARSDLENAINQVQKNLENAQSKLEDMIAEGDKKNADALAEAIEDLNARIEDAKQIAAEADDALRMLLLKAIANAKTGAIESANAALEAARNELQAEIAKGDAANSDALKAAIETLEKAIALAEQTAKTQDAELSQKLEGMIAEAKSELLANLDSVKAELTAAIKKLQEADDKLNADLSGKEKALLDAIESLRAELENTKKSVPSVAAPLVIAIVALLAGAGAIVLIFIFKKKD